MNRLDWIIVRRLLGSVALTLAIIYGLVVLVESLSGSKYATVLRLNGVGVAALAIAAASARWILDTLPLTVLIGAIAGLLSLQTSREMTVIKAAGISIWRMMRAPLATAILAGILVSLFVHAAVVQLDRGINADGGDQQARGGTFWMQETTAPLRYIIGADYVEPGGEGLGAVSIFMLDSPRERIEADSARLSNGEWVMASATRLVANKAAETLTDYRVPTSVSLGDMRAKLNTASDMTVYELASTLASRVNDPAERARTLTQFFRLISLPVALCGSLVIAFAFTAGYRRTNKYGAAVLYGIVLGFVVYVVTEMAARAGEAGALQPIVAVLGPALVAMVAGATVLLNREDGRT